MAPFAVRHGLMRRPDTGVRHPHGGRGLWPIGHDVALSRPVSGRNRQLIEQVCVHVTPKRAQFSENFPNTNCRAIGDLQLCLNEFGLIQAGLQVTLL